jgi:hypothetical protein
LKGESEKKNQFSKITLKKIKTMKIKIDIKIKENLIEEGN